MLTGSRWSGRSSPKISMRSTSLQMRSDFGANELRQRAVAVGALAFEQLRRAPDAGKRVLDLMGEHGGEAGDGARGAAMGELPLDHLRHAALLEHDQHAPGRLWQRPGVEIDELRRVEPVRAQVDAIFVDGGAVPLHLLDKRDERAAEGDDVAEVAFAKHARAHLEKVLGRGVGVVDALSPSPMTRSGWGRALSSASATIGAGSAWRRALVFLVEPLKRCILVEAFVVVI